MKLGMGWSLQCGYEREGVFKVGSVMAKGDGCLKLRGFNDLRNLLLEMFSTFKEFGQYPSVFPPICYQ